jgi:glyoxylase-like metal-dependent hydrolase (beta-lactamase superfamily II)
MKIIPLSEGTFTIDKSKIFVPFDSNKDELQQRPIGSLLVEVQPFLIITSKDILLIDTGLGFSKHNHLQIHTNLSEHGIEPHQITKVLMSHLHKDHAGGMVTRDKFGDYQLAFPNAFYYVQAQEYKYAVDKGFPSYMIEEITALENSKQTVWVNGNGIIDSYIKYEITAAHSPFHQVFWVEENEEIIFFGGDDAPQLQQMKNKFIAKYDYDGKKCMQLRQHWWDEGINKKWTFLFYHDIKTPYCKAF